ncbi:hypothetical protein N7495_001767 [Penicillium taxi]|uniref:uncharacterized protein n=1 Tax=Penicillium taxi TaxID=168475 RepID=UPI0025453110|nr:uncharacterized protein N7495_001767 [Penicillium taxi]KAJ5909085.1 hypothetical protein N7495_001767 [Penicillium taxi]
MDAYPEDYVNHNIPLVLLSGLEADHEDESGSNIKYPLLAARGHKIFSDFPPLRGAVAEELRNVLVEENGLKMTWRSSVSSNGGLTSPQIRFRVKSTGRSYQLPPRKADPPHNSFFAGSLEATSTPFVLHSPISPLTPGSPTFPDGLLTPWWVTKHQDLVPAAVINFFPFALDSNMNSLRDNQLKIEINGLKNEWSSSGFKTLFLVVLISEDGDGYVGEIEDRVAGIRRATNLDPKSIFVIPPDATPAELRDFAKSLFSLLQPSVVEYYRDLSKHARRKRNRGTIPPPTAPPTSGTSQTLSSQGWNVRYEFKLGIFAEFRQEMDAACRNYEAAYGILFGQEVFENIAGWDPRFNDARLLGDALAIRIIRCLLWAGNTTVAVRYWVDHRARTKDIINRRGKGSKNYGWEAWEARWSTVMAQLIRRLETSPLSSSTDQLPESPQIYMSPEKTILPGEQVNPWEHLHHAGYWLYRSAKHTMFRRVLAEQIPIEDRASPDQSSASRIANKTYLFDTYLAPETHVEAPQSGQTGFDHSGLILSTMKDSLEEFSKRQQNRKVESLSLEIAEEYMRNGAWTEAYNFLKPRWSTLSWRRSGWWLLMEKFGWVLRESAVKAQDSEMILRVDWELLNKVFPSRATQNYDIHRTLESFSSEKPKPSVVLRAEDTMAPLTASVVFGKPEGNVGEPLQAQLIITSCAHKSAAPIKLANVKIVFEGCLRPVKLQSDHDENPDITSKCCISSVSLREPSNPGDHGLQSPTSGLSALIGTADLTIGFSQTKVFNLTCTPREAGEAQVASITLLVDEEKFDLACVITDQNPHESYWWQQTTIGPSRRRIGKDRDTGKCKVMPKPPKIRISTPNLKENYYTNERVALTISFFNEEDEPADVSSEIRLFGSPDSTAKLEWLDAEAEADLDPESPMSGMSSPTEGQYHFLKRTVGIMQSSSNRDLIVAFTDTQDAAKYSVEITATYNLVSDAQTPIIKTITVDLSFIRPFEANYEFLPCIHDQPWPNFFAVSDELLGNESTPTAGGLLQKWCLNSKLVSFAVDPLVIEKMSLKLITQNGGAVSTIENEVLISQETPHISPEELRESNFLIDIQKMTLGDRRPSALNFALEIEWKRYTSTDEPPSENDSDITTTTLDIPRFTVPMGEPRVLASATASSVLSGLIHLEYVLENPSTHFLTFNLIMEPSEQFAFSGPKTTAVQLVPLSRHTVRYNILAAKRGLWIQPQLLIVDTYFNKTLRVLSTGEMRSDKKGVLVWVDADD